jgi:hypothetical protein
VATRIADYELSSQSLTIALQATLFSSIVALFIIEIYKMLLPSNGQNAANSPPSTALRINIVLFLSFFLSVTSAVGCALVQQWCDDYKKFSSPRAAPHTRGRIRTYLFRGLEVFQMRRFVYGIHVLLHISFFLFFWALSDFFYIVNHQFGSVSRLALVGSLTIYVLLGVSPLISIYSPYNMPLTRPLRSALIILRIIIRSPLWFPRWIRREPFDLTGLQYYEGIYFDRAHLYSIEAGKEAKQLEPYAMKWLFTDNNFSDTDMDKFLEGLPGYMSSNHTEKGQLDEYLTAGHIKSRIKQHFITCATSVELSDQDSINRASSCVKALVLIFQYSRERKGASSEPDKLKKEIQLQREYIQGLIDDFQTLCRIEDHTTALRASCISALAVQGLLSQLVPPNSETTDISQFPPSLIPIYHYLFPNDNTVTVPQLGDRPTSSTKEMCMSILHDGPLANLTRLAQAIRDCEHVPPSKLSFCWQILDILLTKFGTIHSDKPTRAQSDFEHLHEDTRTYVHGEEMGFRMTPLLEILDAVDRGRRLLVVFSSRPKYHSRATAVFGKEYLRNGDLLEAFAHCLPDFIAIRPPEVCRDFMEKVVCRDDLWSNLQMILWTTQRSTSPISDKSRVFECCCNVLNVAISVLEDSRVVDWRAPEFGSLWLHYESFITHGFQGAFMSRAARFRVGIINARFCKVLLTQFWDDAIRKNVSSFRSQWDVASLTKLTYYLGLRDEDDPESWNSYYNGGHIGAEFTAEALKMIKIITNDGPLLIFCQLGHLVASTIPSYHSGLKRKDIEKVLELQDKLMSDQRLPLNSASDTVWKAIDRLRERVEDLCGATSGGTGDSGNTGEEGELLQSLLRRIDDVRNRRVTRSEDPGHSGHAKERPSAL